MNNDERQQLTRFLEQLALAQAAHKDDEADALIRATCARQPDAAYLLVQRAMLLDATMRNSQEEIARLQGELEQARSQTPSRAGSGFIDANAWGNSPTLRSTQAPAMPPAAAFSPAATPATAVNTAPATSAWGSGMLGTMAGTAAGVVAGGFLFQGIGHLLGNQAAPAGSMHGLSQQASATQDSKAFDSAQNSADIFDTSSVDDYIASDDNV